MLASAPGLEDDTRDMPRVLVAGIGNIFLGDDGFGVAVAEQLAAVAMPATTPWS